MNIGKLHEVINGKPRIALLQTKLLVVVRFIARSVVTL